MTRLYTSRPSMSVPNQCSLEGGLRRWAGESTCGSTVPSHGASNAIKSMSASTIPPRMAVGCLRKASWKRCQVGEADLGAARTVAVISVLDPRVEQPVGEIDQQIDQHVYPGEKQDHALDDRVIPAQNGVDREPANARNCEHRLGDDGAADEQRDADAD